MTTATTCGICRAPLNEAGAVILFTPTGGIRAFHAECYSKNSLAINAALKRERVPKNVHR